MVPLAPTHNRFPLRKNHKYKRPHLVLALTGYFACAYEETSMAMTNVWDGLCWLQFRAVGDLGCCWTILYIEKSQRWEKDTKIMVLSLDFVFCQLWSQLLSKWNGFDYYKLEPGDDPFQEEVKLSTFIKLGLKKAEKKREEHQDKTWPVFVFKHHYYYNTSRKGLNFYFQTCFTIFNAGISDMILDLMNFAARCCINKEMSPTFLTQINGNRSERLIEISTFMP